MLQKESGLHISTIAEIINNNALIWLNFSKVRWWILETRNRQLSLSAIRIKHGSNTLSQ